MNCPKCGLINPDNALRCACGYYFDSSSIEKFYLPDNEQKEIFTIKETSYRKEARIKPFDLRLVLFSVFLFILYIFIPPLKWEWDHGFRLFHSLKYLIRNTVALHSGSNFINLIVAVFVIIGIHVILVKTFNK